jgi:hypothetical protein
MTRASTPLDPLEPITGIESGNSIPVNNRSWFSVGQVVRGVTWTYSSFYLGKLLKESGKGITKQILDLLRRGEQIEYSIAGIEAYYALPTMAVVNQCYLQDGQCHSGLTWHYKVLIKGVLDGKKVCVIPRVWICERDFVPVSEIEFQAKEFYRDDCNHVYKCVIQNSEPLFVYVGYVKNGNLRWDNHISPRRLTHWDRRNFQPYVLPEKILY